MKIRTDTFEARGCDVFAARASGEYLKVASFASEELANHYVWETIRPVHYDIPTALSAGTVSRVADPKGLSGGAHPMSVEERAAMDRALMKSVTVIEEGYLEEAPCKSGSCKRRNMQGGCAVKGCKEPACY
jgi:hypothetical protein